MRAIIIERWAILRHGLRAVLGQSGHPVLSSAASAAEGLTAVQRERKVELVVVGMVDDRDPVDLLAVLAEHAPGVPVLVLADDLDRSRIDALLVAGAAGILGRLAEGTEVVDAIERLGRGERVLSNDVISCLVRAIEPGRSSSEPIVATQLTAREREILTFLATGATNRDIATKLFIGEATVKSHLASAYSKLGVANRHQAVARCVELGVVGAIGGR